MPRAYLRSIPSVIKSRQAFWIIWGAVILFNLFYYMGYVRENRRLGAKLETEYGDARRELARISRQDDTYQAYWAAKQALQTFRRLLPEEKEMETVAGELREIIGGNGLTAEAEIRFKAEGIVDLLLLKYGMTLSLSGTYEQVKRTLADIQNSPRLFSIEKISLAAGTRDGREATLSLTLTTYFRGSMRLQPLEG